MEWYQIVGMLTSVFTLTCLYGLLQAMKTHNVPWTLYSALLTTLWSSLTYYLLFT